MFSKCNELNSGFESWYVDYHFDFDNNKKKKGLF